MSTMQIAIHNLYGKKLPIVLMLTLITISTASGRTTHDDEHNHANDPFEPTVTKKESILLNSAMSIAATNTAQAIKILSTKDLDEASPALDFAIGNLNFQSDNLDEAVSSYQAALKKLPKFRSAIMNLGRVYLIQDHNQDAIALYQQLITDGQADADILLLLGHAFLIENLPVSAESAYRQSLLLRHNNEDAMLGLAKALMQQERYAEGLALVGEILNNNPTNRELWSLRTNAYLSMGKQADAMRTIEKAQRLGCANSEMLATMGDLLLNSDQPEDALRTYKMAFCGETPSIKRILRATEGFIALGNTNNAKEMITSADNISKTAPDRFDNSDEITLLRLKAELAQQTGQFSEAMNLCQKVLRIDPLDGRTMLVLVDLQQNAGLLEDAVMTCERAARINNFEADALVRQAQIEIQREQYRRAVSLLEAAQTFKDQPHVARYLEQIRRMVN